MWTGGRVPLGYDNRDKQLVVNEEEASRVRFIYKRYLALGSTRELKAELDAKGIVSKYCPNRKRHPGGAAFSRGALYHLLANPLYTGRVRWQGDLVEGLHTAIVPLELWQQVQDQLTDNCRTKCLRLDSKHPSLLTGILYDDRGNTMIPPHNQCRGKRYRYYMNQAVLQYREQEAGSVIRLPAEPIESLVIQQITQLLRDSAPLLTLYTLLDLSAADQESLVNNAQDFAKTLQAATAHEHMQWLHQIVESVVVSKTQLITSIKKQGLLEQIMSPGFIAAHPAMEELHRQTQAVQLKRYGIETKLVIPAGPPPAAHSRSVKALQQALHKALVWNQALLDNKAQTLADIGKQEGVNERYVGQLIRLAYLAPDIMERIFAGDVPAKLSLESIKRKGIALDWHTQRRQYDFVI